MHSHQMLFRSALIISLALGSGGLSSFAETGTHAGHQASDLALTLNAGAKWQGDENMVQGMNAIRASLAAAIHAIHSQTLPPDHYKSLAADIQGQVDFMVANCKLTPEVDEQFHLVLGEVLDGISEMENGPNHEAGAVRIVSALNSYGEYFVHPGWQSLE